MYEWPLLVVLAVRVASVPLVQTWFVPDEYWQATEVAHAMAFRYGYKTWEWREGIRGALYPASFAALFKVMFFLGADTPALLIHIPRLLHAVAFAIGDYHIWKLSKSLYGSASAGWTVVCLSTAWFLSYCAPRTLTSCVETVLLAVAFSHYPWRRERDSPSAKYLWPVGLACAIRPTAAVPFLPLAVRHLCHSSCRGRLLLHYSLITTVIVAVTVGVDSWYYGELVVVPWRFVHFNVVTGLSSHYGILPWHWYLSQGLPATLTTHVLPLVAALVSQPSRHRDLLPVILWSLLVYSCLGHKEFRFLLPVLPLCLCIAGDHIAFHLAAHAKKTGDSSRLRRTVIFLVLLIPNLTALVYLGLIHQRGPLDTMQILRQEIEVNPRASILFLMPCHSTPYYSHLHSNVTMRFLTCEPNLKFEAHYMDEADLFEKDPHAWLQQELGSQQPAFPEAFSTRQDEGRNLGEENHGSGNMVNERRKIKGNEREGKESLAGGMIGNGKEERDVAVQETENRRVKVLGYQFGKVESEKEMGTDGIRISRGDALTLLNRNEERKAKLRVESKKPLVSNIGSDPMRGRTASKVLGSEERDEKELKYGMTKRSTIDYPSHIVMFSILKDKLEDFLNKHHYHLCHQLFHSHTNDGRRSQHIHIYCWRPITLQT